MKTIKRIFSALMLLITLGFVPSVQAQERPNIVLIITDDMGFSDIGCYGGEIHTPNIDKLADSGLKFSQFYNSGKCEPSRAALITGQQFWTYNPEVKVRIESPNFGEVIHAAGYRTMMVGKWHASGIPYERGFDRHFGFMGGGTNSFLGDDSYLLDGKSWKIPKDFYATNALTDHAVQFIREEKTGHPQQPFFLYLAYNAPHAPILAPADEIAKYRGKYLKGWDAIRKDRFEKQKALGLAGSGWKLPERPANIPAWESLSEKEKDIQDLRMATYAAMVDIVDQGVGKVLKTLEELGISDNTLVIFMNDNGASPNDRIRRGELGTPTSKWNMGVAWANVANTPFKFYKRTQHSGGITTPFIAHWPAGIKPQKKFEDQPCHITDILPTLIELAETKYPDSFGNKPQPPIPGISLVPVLKNNKVLPERTLHFSLFNNMAVIDKGWKLVTAYSEPWQLYDLTNDRSETHDLSKSNPEKLKEMLNLQKTFFNQPDVRPILISGEREPEFSPIFNPEGKLGPGARENVDDPEFSLLLAKAHAEGREPDKKELEIMKKQAAAQRANNPESGK